DIHSPADLGHIGHTVAVYGKGAGGIRLCLIHGSIGRRIDTDVRADLREHGVEAGLLREGQYGPTTPHDGKARLVQAGEEFLGQHTPRPNHENAHRSAPKRGRWSCGMVSRVGYAASFSESRGVVIGQAMAKRGSFQRRPYSSPGA